MFVSFLALSLALGCASNYRQANDVAVEKLRQQLVAERFGEIYRESSEINRAQLSTDEFSNTMSAPISYLKDVDEELNWRRDERGSPEEGVYRDDNWSSLILEKDGKRVDVQLNWDERFRLCGMAMSGDIPEGGIRIFRNCD